MFGAHGAAADSQCIVIARGQRAEVRGRNHGPPGWEAAPRSLAYVAGRSQHHFSTNTSKKLAEIWLGTFDAPLRKRRFAVDN